MYRLFIVEDDKGIAEAICTQAQMWEMEVCCAQDFRRIMAEFARFDPHIVLMDISLPFFNGYHWCSEIRRVSRVPIIFISSAADNMNMVMAMNMGADDFIAKPFDQNVLVAKVQAMLRRAYSFGAETCTLEHRGAVLDMKTNTLNIGGQDVPLSRNEYRVLLLLMQAKGRIVSREKLMSDLWSTDCFVDDNTLTVNVGRLRRKLENAGLKDFIKTRFGVGYYIE